MRLKNIIKNNNGTSSTIGVLLMVVITVILAVIVLVMSLSFELPDKAPMSIIYAEPGYEHNIIMTHKGGDALDAGRWSLSIVPTSSPPAFQKMNTTFTVGDMLYASIRTDGSGKYFIDTSNLLSDEITAGYRDGETIHITIRDDPSQIIVMDDTVTVW